ncbi:unnamed protein product [Nezara viridula]|uniref:Uncharacterized protein n=1 Tax=Nezara viridula TaxID=85310 RepID=A0A9P0HF73_NEZVI|nr:unnamed protein product [Nezara viridula]
MARKISSNPTTILEQRDIESGMSEFSRYLPIRTCLTSSPPGLSSGLPPHSHQDKPDHLELGDASPNRLGNRRLEHPGYIGD